MSNLIIGPGRLSFPALFQPMSADMGGKYGMTLLLPPDYDTKPLVSALDEAAVKKWGEDKSKWPKKMNGPKQVIRDAVEKAHLAGYEAGWKFIALKSQTKPNVVGPDLSDILDASEAYAGRWVRVSARAYAYDNVLKGVGFGLQNVQLLKHDDKFGGSGPAKNDFDPIAEEVGSGNWND